MFKSFFEWLVSSHPVPNWLLIILLLLFAGFCAAIIGFAIRAGEDEWR